MAYLLQKPLEESARRQPEKIAVWARGRTLTYRDLNERSNQLAHLLRDRGVKKGDRVGLCLPKSVESVVSMLGALKAGAVYVPLDPQAPSRRLSYIIGNCAMKALITTKAQLQALDPTALRTVSFSLLLDHTETTHGDSDSIPWSWLSTFPCCHPPQCDSIEDDLAYILYTSGSTGEPKGVMLSHRNALTFVDWCAETFQIRTNDRLSNHAPLHFDLSVFDIYNSIQAGATVYLVPDEVVVFPASLASFIEENGISVWYSVPSALVLLLLHGNLASRNLERLRLILFAGEPFAMKYLRQLAELLPRVDLYNLFGPTETNVCTYYRVERLRLANMDQLPIGRACANTDVFVVNDDGESARPGEMGELYVRGPSVTKGYWGDPEKIKQVLVTNRFQPHFVEKMYRTGDMVRLGDDGNYCFMGRRDSMIKSRGYRIELGEIEAALYSHAGVRETAVVAIPDDEVGNRIKAFVALNKPDSLTKAEIQEHCARRIPRYMLPEIIEFCESLPKTSTGKVDRKRLAQTGANHDQQGNE